MTIDEKIRDEKLQFSINREAAEVLALLSDKLINMKILEVKKYCFQIMKQAKSTNSPFGKAFQKKIKKKKKIRKIKEKTNFKSYL